MTDFNALIPELADWNNGKGIDIDSWIGCTGNFQLAVGYSRVFWPGFVEYEGMVLREEAFTAETVDGWLNHYEGDTSSVEAMVNHLHLETLHYHAGSGATRDRLVYLGHVLAEIHKVKLAHDFPSRTFEVLFDDSTKEELMDYQLTFFQKR